MRNILENLLTAAEKVKKPSPKLKQAIKAAEKRLHELDSREELKKLGQALKDANPKTFITFKEDHDPENRYAIVVNTEEHGLLRKLAKIFGCLEEELPEDDAVEFEAGDHWHGRGEINLRTLADELIQIHGPFFSSVFTVEELQRFARD
jgi:hypothetical protein